MFEDLKMMMDYRYRSEWRTKGVTLKEVEQWTREEKHKSRVKAVRGLGEASTEMGMACGPAAAGWLPKVRPAQHVKGGYTGLVLLSFRVPEGVQALEQLRRKVNLWEQTLMSFVGSSGQSLKVLIPYCLNDGKLPVEERQVALFQQHAFKRAAEYALNSTGVRPEAVSHDGTEHFCLSCDPEVYLNYDVKPILMEQPTEELPDDPLAMADRPADVPLDAEVLPGYTRREMDGVKFNFVCRQLSFDREKPLDEHLVRLATACRKAGIDQELATKMTLGLLDCYDKDVLVRTMFNTAYSGHRLGRQNPVEPAMMHQILLEDFLRRRYMFRRNKVTGEVEVQEKHRYELWWKPLTQEVQNDINTAAIREGIKVWPKDMERILFSERIDTYDPVREWLDALPQWDGRDRLGELADRVKAKSPYWQDDFRVWMRSMVSQWRSGRYALYGAQMVLMFVGGQGTRKSTFMRLLLPRELMPFYIDRIDFTNKKEALHALSRFLLINIDEYDQISKAQTAFLKHLIQRTDVKERKLFTTVFEQQQRYAAFCATTNSLMPLKDESGSRRYLVVEVTDKIDTDTQGDKAIDYRQLYAQIVSEIEAGEDYAFTGERENRIVEQNTEYYEMPNAVALFDDLFRKPQAGDEVLLLTPTEILTQIRDIRKVNVVSQSNATVLGGYLSRGGFVKGEGGKRRCYQVALRT